MRSTFATGIIAMAMSTQAEAILNRDYNQRIVYFFGDLGPTIPCHPLYEREYTWTSADDDSGVRSILNGLINAGFNGVRLPMFPDGDAVTGENPYRPSQTVNGTYCNSLVENIANNIINASDSDAFKGMYIYLSPAYDSRLYQEDLKEQEYKDWLMQFISDKYKPDFLSPFSAAQSILELQAIPAESIMSAPETEYELTVLSIL